MSRAFSAIAGTMMTFTEDPEFDPEQLQRFNTLSQELERSGVRLGRRHTASSFALFQHPESFLEMVRPGMVNRPSRPGRNRTLACDIGSTTGSRNSRGPR